MYVQLQLGQPKGKQERNRLALALDSDLPLPGPASLPQLGNWSDSTSQGVPQTMCSARCVPRHCLELLLGGWWIHSGFLVPALGCALGRMSDCCMSCPV
jgi:hypothetical protein